MTNPEELRQKFSRSPARLLRNWIIVLVVVGAALLPVARPTWRALKSWRADQFISEAEDLLAQKQVSLAYERARSALQLVPTRPDALRLNARLLTRIGSDAGLVFWQRLLDTGHANSEDCAAFVETALAMEYPELVRPVIQRFEVKKPRTDLECRLTALYYLQTRQADSAIASAREAHQLAASNPTNSLLLARLLMRQTNNASETEARRLLWQIAEADHPLRLEALRHLVTTPFVGHGREDCERARTILSAMTSREPAADILLAETGIRLDPVNADNIARRLIEDCPPKDWSRLGLVAEALLRQRRYQDVLDVTGEGKALVSRSLFLTRYEALLGMSRTEEAYRHLLNPEAPLQPFELAIFRARGAQDARHIDKRDVHLRELLVASEDHPARLMRVAHLAEAGRTREAVGVAADAWRKLSTRPDQAVPALRHLQRLSDQQGDTWTARNYARQASRLATNDLRLQLDVAYYDLLLGENLDEACAEAQRQMKSNPQELHPRMVVALGYLRQGSPELAKEVLDRLVLSGTTMQNDALAVVVATYGLNGLEGKARELAEKISIAALRPEERELIRRWLIPPPLAF